MAPRFALQSSQRRRKSPPDATVAIAYLRASKAEQHNSPEAQRADIEAYAARHGLRIAAWCLDHGVSGATPIDERPGFLEALGGLREHGAGVLLVQKRDRLARDTMVAAMAERLLARDGVAIHSADGVANGDGPADELLRGILDLFSQYERAIIRARTKAGLRAKQARGERTGGRAPYGFADSPGELVPDPAEQAVIERIHHLRAERGYSYAQVAARLNAEGVPARGKRWYATTVQRIIGRAAP